MSDTEPTMPTELSIDPQAVPPGRRPGRIAAAIVAAVAVVGAGVFAVTALAGDGSSPEDPVRAMFEAAEKGDALGVLEQFEPGERDALKGSLIDLTDELNRLDILDHASLGHLTGIDVQIKDLKLTSIKARDDIADVRIESGTGSYQFDASKLPLGSFVRDLAGSDLDQAKSSGSDTLRSKTPDDNLTVVKRDGRWYISIGYTIAESARKGSKIAIDALGSGVPGRGTDTPEAAVRDFIDASAKLDVRRLIELLPPDEMAALHEYAGLFIGDAERGVADARGYVDINIDVDLAADTSGSRSLVTITKGTFDASFAGMKVSFDGKCSDVTVPGSPPQHFCPDTDPNTVLRSIGAPAGLNLPPIPQFSFMNKKGKFGIVVVQVDGKWYLSPTRTMLDNVVEALRLVQPSDLTTGRDYVRQLIDLAKGMTTGMTGTGMPTPAPTPG